MNWLTVTLVVVAIWLALLVLIVCFLWTIGATNARALELEREYARERLDFELHGFGVRVDDEGDVVELDERRRHLRPDAAHDAERRESS